ncbi:MAG: secretion system protein, partial [Wolbachia sp.]
MAILKCLILLFIISCTHLPKKQHSVNIDNYKHDYSLQQYNTPLKNN